MSRSIVMLGGECKPELDVWKENKDMESTIVGMCYDRICSSCAPTHRTSGRVLDIVTAANAKELHMYKKNGFGRSSDARIHVLDAIVISQADGVITTAVTEMADCKIFAPCQQASRQHVQIVGDYPMHCQSRDFLIGLLRASLACHQRRHGSDSLSVRLCSEAGDKFGTGFVVVYKCKQQQWVVHTRVLDGMPYLLTDVHRAAPSSRIVTRSLLCTSCLEPLRSARVCQTSRGRLYSVETRQLDSESSEMGGLNSISDVMAVACASIGHYNRFCTAFVQAGFILRKCADALDAVRRKHGRSRQRQVLRECIDSQIETATFMAV